MQRIKEIKKIYYNYIHDCVNVRWLPESNSLYGSSIVSNEPEQLHQCFSVVENKPGFQHFCEQVWVKKLVHESLIHFGTWNIDILPSKSMDHISVIDCGWRIIAERQKSAILGHHKTPLRPWHRHPSHIGHSGWQKIHHRNLPWPLFDNTGSYH